MGLRAVGLVGALLCAASIAGAGNAPSVDWSKAKPIEDPGVQWGVIPLDGGKVEAFFGRPESDYVVVRVGCPAPKSLSFSYIDFSMKPNTAYRVALRAGRREIEVPGSTSARWEMDDLVELQFGPTKDRQLYDSIRTGAELRLFIQEAAGGWNTALAMPGDAKALAPFFAACGK